jgi:hypothetical protein
MRMRAMTTATGFRVSILQGDSVHVAQGGFEVVLSVADVHQLINLMVMSGRYDDVLDKAMDEAKAAEWAMPDRTQAVVSTVMSSTRCEECGRSANEYVVLDGRLVCSLCR